MSIALLVSVLGNAPAEAQLAPYRMPETLPYQPGHAPPPGYHVEQRPQRDLVATGGAVFGGFYLPAVALAAMFVEREPAFGWLAVPFLGPLVAISTFERCEQRASLCVDDGLPVVAALLGMGELFGAFLFCVGLSDPPEPVLVRDAGWAVVPRRFGAHGVGLAVVVPSG